MLTKFIHLMVVGMVILLVSSPALATGYNLQNKTIQNANRVSARASPGKYTNPLSIQIPGDGLVESCADPTIIQGQTAGDTNWYMYCTTDPLNGNDNTDNSFNFHLIPMLRSSDLVNWTYQGDAFRARPGWVADDAGLWAPEIQFFNGQYYLYYTASWTDLPGGGSAIGVARSSTPLGPWVDSGTPVVEPHAPQCCPADKRWVFDPDVVQDDGGQRYIFYGSYFGGISVRTLSADGLHSDPASQTQVTIANRYEGTEVVRHDGYWYLFASATDCCRGPLTGYSVFAGRSQNILGPYVDREGNSLLQGRVGGTPVISMNGNRWVGTGHNSVFEDFDGQWWTVYHAVDRNDPYFAGAVGFTKRPVLMDALDWVDGWPTVRGGLWASDKAQPAPAAQPGTQTNYEPKLFQPDQPAALLPSLSDEFNGSFGTQWSWVRPPASDLYSVSAETLDFNTQAADLFEGSNNASILTEPAPNGNYLVETRFKLNLPAAGCCFTYRQAGLVIYGKDDNYVKLVHVSIWETRQTEFAKELAPVPAGYPRYGNTVVGAPGEWTYLRIVKRTSSGAELYTAYTSTDGLHWVRGGTWTHQLGSNVRIGLVAMGGSAFTANFDYVHVYELAE